MLPFNTIKTQTIKFWLNNIKKVQNNFILASNLNYTSSATFIGIVVDETLHSKNHAAGQSKELNQAYLVILNQQEVIDRLEITIPMFIHLSTMEWFYERILLIVIKL